LCLSKPAELKNPSGLLRRVFDILLPCYSHTITTSPGRSKNDGDDGTALFSLFFPAAKLTNFLTETNPAD
jgi:hypothetical protein